MADSFDLVHLWWIVPCGLMLFQMILNAIFLGVRWGHGEYKGHPVYVRFPKKGGWDTMNWKHEDFTMGNTFTSLFYYHFSAVIVPLEVHAHKWALHMDAKGFDGFLAQELNHGVFQTIYNKNLSELYYPALFWQRFYTFLLIDVFPQRLGQGIICILETGFIAMTYWMPVMGVVDIVLPGPRWLWRFHLTEESEHCWSSVADTMELPWMWRFVAFILFNALFLGVALIIVPIEAIVHIRLTWKRLLNPMVLIPDVLFYCMYIPVFAYQVISLHIMQNLLHMRPSDAAYAKINVLWQDIYKEIDHLFTVKCSLDPEHPDNIKLRPRADVKIGAGEQVQIMYNADGTIETERKRESQMPMLAANSLKTVSSQTGVAEHLKELAMNSVVYDVAIKQLLEAGLSKIQIKKLFMANPLEVEYEDPDEVHDEVIATVTADGVGGEGGLKTYTKAEIRKHKDKSSLWLIIGDLVYDITSFVDEHPGGAYPLETYGGKECTVQFETLHSDNTKEMVKKYLIGKVAPEARKRGKVQAPGEVQMRAVGPPVTLDGTQKVALRMIQREKLTHDVCKFTFELPTEAHTLGIKVGEHVSLSASINSKNVSRSYTPTSFVDATGEVELVMKIYRKSEKFPEGGLLSQYLENLELYEKVDFYGPIGHISYEGAGAFSIEGKARAFPKIGMVAGGTGVTPMFQVIQHALKDASPPNMSLLCANRSPDDVLLFKDLAALADKHTVLKVAHTVNEATADWKGFTGFVSAAMLKDTMPPASSETAVFLCGPPPMVDALKKTLGELGYENVFAF